MHARLTSISIFLALGWGLLASRSEAESTLFYVSRLGSDQWSGTLPEPNAAKTDGPLASLTAARNAVRGLKKQGVLTRPIDVCIHGGTYDLENGLLLTAEDSGSEACPITYRASGA